MSDFSAARVQMGLSDGLTFVFVEAESPLSKAGIAPGDVLVGMNGKTFAKGARGLRDFQKEYEKLAPIPTPLVIARGGEQRTVTVTPERLPRLQVRYNTFAGDFNAFADGEALYVKRGLLRGTTSDDALAMVLAHEIAHNCQLHIEAKKTNQRIGAVFDVLSALGGVPTNGAYAELGAGAYSQDFEREADYVGLYYLARAGRPLDESIKMYRVMTVETSPSALQAAYGASHPSNPERYVRLQSVLTEIQGKAQRGEPLVPDKKK